MEKLFKLDKSFADKIKQQCGFLAEDDIKKLITLDRLFLVLVRCGAGRFLCPVQDVKHFMSIIREHNQLKFATQEIHGEYVRDVSVPV